jgi:endonuclease/exonuclease/phosphatase (EEP) superfamily protein YafD
MSLAWMTSVLALYTLLGFLGQTFWAFDLFAHFRLQYFLVAVPVAGGLLWRKRWVWSAVAVAVASVNAWHIWPASLQDRSQPSFITADTFSVLAFNVNAKNLQHDQILGLLQNVQADLVILQELTPALATKVQNTLHTQYPRMLLLPQDHSFGIGILSRWSDAELSRVDIKGSWNHALLARFGVGQETCELYALHPPPPIGADFSHARNTQILAIAHIIQASSVRCKMLAGDLNLTPYSPWFTVLEQTSGLRNSMKNHALQTTWPTFLPFAFLRIPIDHVLVSPALVLDRWERGPGLGSDHFPVAVKLKVRS